MLARAGLIVLALTSPALGESDEYPAGLFENSPLNSAPGAGDRSRDPKPPRQAEAPPPVERRPWEARPVERAGIGCHHYLAWYYPWPQPCHAGGRANVAEAPPVEQRPPWAAPPVERAGFGCHHYLAWYYPWPQPCDIGGRADVVEAWSVERRPWETPTMPRGPWEAPPAERAGVACHHYRAWYYPWPQPC